MDTPSPARSPDGPGRTHLLTVVVEDYYQHSAFNRLIQPSRWRRFETRVERNTDRALDLLDEFGLRATFFTIGWIAEEMPEVVRKVADRGHEVASKGFFHRTLRQMDPSEFRDDLVRSREAIERASGRKVLGYRVARGTFTPADTWALDILADEGFAYDSSIYPRLFCIAGQPFRRFPHEHRRGDRVLHEVPLSSFGPSWFTIPMAGGNYFRQVPDALVRLLVARWDRRREAPFNLYFHVWELDPDIPKIAAVGPLTRIRQYRNLGKMSGLLRDLFGRYRFTSIAEHLGLDVTAVSVPASPATADPLTPPARLPASAPRLPVTVVVPVFNEELALPYLANTLDEVAHDLPDRYDLHFLFVDDGSTDSTWESLHRLFGARPRHDFVRHDRNRGVAAAILTGIEHASTEVVCSIDCDCTYDPRQLAGMIPLLTDGVDMVTASPYHPDGEVLNVPAWRLSLSKTLSFLYGRVLHNRLSTYTACFRVYRRPAMQGMTLRNGGFLGVAEMFGHLDLRGSRIAEYPAVLEVRMLGHSKMKILRTILGHLWLLGRFAAARWRSARPSPGM